MGRSFTVYSDKSLPVPMSIRRYTCRESALTTSPSSRYASCTARAVLPLAVGPSTVINGFIVFSFMMLPASPGASPTKAAASASAEATSKSSAAETASKTSTTKAAGETAAPSAG